MSNRYSGKERLLMSLDLGVWSATLGAITLILYYGLEYYSTQTPELNFYFFGLIAGATGGLWSFGYGVSYDFYKDIKNREIDVEQSFGHHFLRQIVQLVVSFIIVIIMWWIIAVF